jgi:hypothetical protein
VGLWSDNGHEALFFPGPDAYVDRVVHSNPPKGAQEWNKD